MNLVAKKDELASFTNNNDFIAPGSAFFLAKNGASVKTMRILSEKMLLKMWKKSDSHWRCASTFTPFWSWLEVGFPRIEWMFLR